MCDSIDFDSRRMTLSARYDVKMISEDTEPVFEIAQPVETCFNLLAVDVQLIVMGIHLRYPYGIALPSIAEHNLAANIASNLWAAAQGGRVELGTLNF